MPLDTAPYIPAFGDPEWYTPGKMVEYVDKRQRQCWRGFVQTVVPGPHPTIAVIAPNRRKIRAFRLLFDAQQWTGFTASFSPVFPRAQWWEGETKTTGHVLDRSSLGLVELFRERDSETIALLRRQVNIVEPDAWLRYSRACEPFRECDPITVDACVKAVHTFYPDAQLLRRITFPHGSAYQIVNRQQRLCRNCTHPARAWVAAWKRLNHRTMPLVRALWNASQPS